MGVAVQVFHNLGTLTDTVLTTVKGCSNNIQQQTQDALNPATLTEGECAADMLLVKLTQRANIPCSELILRGEIFKVFVDFALSLKFNHEHF